MRKIVFVSLLALLVGLPAGTSLAKRSAVDDGCLVIDDAATVLHLNVVRGTVFGRLQGRLTITDKVDGDGPVKVTGADDTVDVNETTTRYESDSELRFRTSGRVRIIINSPFLNLSFVGRGTARLNSGDFAREIIGRFSIDSESFCEEGFRPSPRTPTTFTIGGP